MLSNLSVVDTLPEMVRDSRLAAGLFAFAILAAACTASSSVGGTVSVTAASTSAVAGDPSSTVGIAPAAAPPSSSEPSYRAAVVDGDPGEWDLGLDFFADMYRAGKPDKDVLSKLYVRYACDTETLYVLVLTEPDWEIISSDSDNFVKLGNSNKLVDGASGNDGTPPDFEYVEVTGWEASSNLSPGSYSNLNVHAQVAETASNSTDETSAVVGRAIPIDIACDTSSTTTSTVLSSTTTDNSPASTTTTEGGSSTTSSTVAASTTTTSPSATSTTAGSSTTSSVGGSSTTLVPGDSTTSTQDVGGSSIVGTTTEIGSETLPNTGPEDPFGPTALVVWVGVLTLIIGGLMVRVVRDRS